MSYLQFNKDELVNLEYSLKREVLSTNHAGGYMNTTIVCCNTRKYHGLLVVPVRDFGDDKFVLLSSLDETVIQHGKEFNLGIHRYGDIYEPKGHKYIKNFEIEKVVSITYTVGGVLLRKDIMFPYKKEQILIRYTLLEAHSPTILRLKPFLAFRNFHALSKVNNDVNRHYDLIENGVAFKMYEGFPYLNMQLSVKSEFISSPDWYYNIEYKEERRRAYESAEDLFVPGFFEMSIKKGQQIIFSASTNVEKPAGLSAEFTRNENKRGLRDSFEQCLQLAAKQFVINYNGDTTIYTGYPWLGKNNRNTLISLPGLTIALKRDIELFNSILKTFIKNEQRSLFSPDCDPDIPLWLFWTLQQYLKETGNKSALWREYGEILTEIIESYIGHRRENVFMHETGLLWAEREGKATSWMDTVINGLPLIERVGYQIELNALWYNALCFAADIAPKVKESSFVKTCMDVKSRVEHNFRKAFWIEGRDYLADYVGPEGQNKYVRPNQLFTCAFDYSPLDDDVKAMVIQSVKKELLTTRGIRTLSPKNSRYKGEYDGDEYSRSMAYFQGTTRVWLLQFYIEACFKILGKSFLNRANEIVYAFEEDLSVHCIGSISEVYDGDPPHQPHGCTSYSASIAALLRSMSFIEQYKNIKQ
ncbi:MAG: glycogen debranching enzyme N-terminal domain-containing protein [Rikenellaceae bacterium]|nr:glycogen debranching enzyme N-terminal domain-containing protein [Rikenellaceae bacterium]